MYENGEPSVVNYEDRETILFLEIKILDLLNIEMDNASERERGTEGREHSTNIKESQQAANFNSTNFYFWFVVDETFTNTFVTCFWLKWHQTQYNLAYICLFNKR